VRSTGVSGGYAGGFQTNEPFADKASANQTSRDPRLVMRWFNGAYVNCLTKQHQKSTVHNWYTSGDFQDAKKLLDDGNPQLEEEIDYEAMGL